MANTSTLLSSALVHFQKELESTGTIWSSLQLIETKGSDVDEPTHEQYDSLENDESPSDDPDVTSAIDESFAKRLDAPTEENSEADVLEGHLDDILIECFSLPGRSTGRIGLIDGGDAKTFGELTAWYARPPEGENR